MKGIGIDIGTTTISGVVYDADEGGVKSVRNVPNESMIRTDRGWERIQDAEWICRKAAEVLEDLLGEYPETEAIGLTGQMHGIVYVNRDGEAVSPLYTWQDGRGDLPEFKGKPLTARIEEKTGIFVPSGYGLVTHLYNLKRNLVPKEGGSLCTISDYVGMKLTGRKQPLVHVSNGASLGFFNSKEGCFLTEKAEEAGIDPKILPPVTGEIQILGRYRQIPVSVAIGDNQAGFLGSVGTEENILLLNMGTGGQISVLSKEYREIPGIECRPFAKGKYLLVGASLCGGKAYGVLERFFRSYAVAAGGKDEPQYRIMEKLARAGLEEADSSLTVVTAFNGTRQDPCIRGSIANIGMDNFTPEGLVYGTLKGMVRELFDLYGMMENQAGIKAEKIIASGNGFRKNPVLQEIAGRMFGTGVMMASCEEEAACGGARSGIMAVSRKIQKKSGK